MKRILLMVGLLIVLLGGAGAGFFFTAPSLPAAATNWVPASLRPKLHLAPLPPPPPPPKPVRPPGPPAFYDLPDILTEMPIEGRHNELVRLAISLKLGGMQDVPAVQDAGPRIRDAFQVYLRDTRIGNLERPAELQRFRKEMLKRIQDLVAPAEVDQILVREVQIQ